MGSKRPNPNKARFYYLMQPRGIHHILHDLTKTARLLYDSMLLKIGRDGWTEVIDSAWLRRETGFTSVSVSRAKSELIKKKVIRQKQFKIDGKPLRGAYQYYLLPEAMENGLLIQNAKGDD